MRSGSTCLKVPIPPVVVRLRGVRSVDGQLGVDELVGMGEISEIHLADGTPRYDPKTGPDHHHLLCDRCGLTYDVEPLGVAGSSLPRAQRYGMTVDTVEVVFRGRCSCAERL